LWQTCDFSFFVLICIERYNFFWHECSLLLLCCCFFVVAVVTVVASNRFTICQIKFCQTSCQSLWGVVLFFAYTICCNWFSAPGHILQPIKNWVLQIENTFRRKQQKLNLKTEIKAYFKIFRKLMKKENISVMNGVQYWFQNLCNNY